MNRWALGAGIGALGVSALALGALALFSAAIARRVERALPPAGSFIDVDGTRLHYVERGSGPPIVMIHGLAGQSQHFTHSLVDVLTDEFRVIAVDRPGAGYSARAPDANVRAQAAVIAGFIAALGLERPFVVGHSLGGAVALALALDFPEAVSGLALVAPFTHPNHAVPEPFRGLVIRSPLVRSVVAWTIAVPGSIRLGRAGVAAVFHPELPPTDFATSAGGLLAMRPRAFESASRDFMAANSDMRALAARYPSLTVPVSVLFGTSDTILDHRVHGVQLSEKVPQIELTLIQGGHMLPISAALTTAEWIRSRAHAAVS